MLGASQTFHDPAKNTDQEVWEQNAAFIYVPFVVVAAILAWTMLKSVPVRANFRQQLDIFSNADTWWMTALYVMTFGIFSGLAAQFGLLIKNLYGAGNPEIVATAADGSTSVLVAGYAVPLALTFAFIGPLVGAGARVAFSPLTDKFGGARWTLVAGIGILLSLLFTIQHVNPDPGPGRRRADRRVPLLPLRLHRHLLLHRHRQRLDLQADADDLRAPPGRRRDRLGLGHRGLRPVPVRHRAGRHVGLVVPLGARRVHAVLHRHHLGALRTSRRTQALLTASPAGPRTSAGTGTSPRRTSMDISIDAGPDSPTTSGGCAGGTCTCEKGGAAAPLLDVRAIPSAVRHAAVRGALGAIPVAGSLLLAAPHDPIPLLTELEADHPGEFDVSYVERGPDTWLLQLTRQQ